jgi:hypothetical protein
MTAPMITERLSFAPRVYYGARLEPPSNVLGIFSLLLSSLIFIGIVLTMIGGIFMSTKPLFQLKRGKGPKSYNEPQK